METEKLIKRISMKPEVMVGKPVIKGTRLTVRHIVGLLASGMMVDTILNEYEELDKEDIQACLVFATETLANSTFMPLASEEG
ncbi:MAG: DUF433 domain-containing protein [Candidatus Neomarinimicrobiota bacterium]